MWYMAGASGKDSAHCAKCRRCQALEFCLIMRAAARPVLRCNMQGCSSVGWIGGCLAYLFERVVVDGWHGGADTVGAPHIEGVVHIPPAATRQHGTTPSRLQAVTGAGWRVEGCLLLCSWSSGNHGAKQRSPLRQ